MTNQEPATEVFFAVELLSDGSLQIHREEVPWSTGERVGSVPEIAEIASRVVKELERHILVDQLATQVHQIVEMAVSPQDIPFSVKVADALKERGITPGQKDE